MTRTRQERLRLGFMCVIIALFFIVTIARLVHLQIYLHDPYYAQVERQSSGRVAIPAERGLIYDRNGQLVAKNVIRSSLYAYPNDDAQVQSIGSYLDRALGLSSGEGIKKYKLQPNRFRWVMRRIEDDEARKFERESIPGLFLRDESYREYPFGTVGKQIVGFTDIDNQGQSSLELAFDSVLTGENGWADIRRDGLRNTYRIKEAALVKPVAGKSLVLSVDWKLQDIVEEELRKAVDSFHAARGMALFIDCNNGDILAMSHYDPNEIDRDKPTKLRAINDQYEPGSVFKVFTAAGVIDAGKADYHQLIDCENGAWNLGAHTLHDDKRHGMLNFRQIIELSSNIGIAKYAMEVDGDEMFDVYKRFGFGKRLKCGLPGESPGRLAPPPEWSRYNIAALAMGHSIAITPLQLVAAMGAVANGGDLVRPHVILGHVDNDGFVVRDVDRPVITRVVKSASLDSLKAFLRGVVKNGTAKVVNSDVVNISGKTGTAQLPDTVTHTYFQHKFAATFAGFFPSEAPVVAGAVILIDPQPLHYGGLTSGPAFRKIAERFAVMNPEMLALPQGTMAKEKGATDSTTVAPNLVGLPGTFAQELVAQKGITLRSTSTEGSVVWQYPPAGRTLFKGDEILVVVSQPTDSLMRMPDMIGLGLRKAAAFLKYAGITHSIKGSGKVVSQSLPAGVLVTRDSVCLVQCQKMM